MNPRQTNPRQTSPRSGLTIAELCQAIGDQRIPTQRKDDDYVVRGSDLRRLARTSAAPRSSTASRTRRTAC